MVTTRKPPRARMDAKRRRLREPDGVVDFSQLSRSPELRLDDVRFEELRLAVPFDVAICDPTRTFLYHVRHGEAWLECGRGLVHAPADTVIGLEVGCLHVWRSTPGSTRHRVLERGDMGPFSERCSDPSTVDILMSSVDHRTAVLHKLDGGIIIIREDDDPEHRAIFALRTVQDQELALGDRADPGIVRRLSEAITLGLVRLARGRVERDLGPLLPSLRHDERILRAQIAFLQEPARKWTLRALADVAGLSRTAFAIRFRAVVGEPPLHCLTRLRLQRAAMLLTQGRSTLDEVAQTVGYGSAASLIRAFRKSYNMSPGQWRVERAGRD